MGISSGFVHFFGHELQGLSVLMPMPNISTRRLLEFGGLVGHHFVDGPTAGEGERDVHRRGLAAFLGRQVTQIEDEGVEIFGDEIRLWWRCRLRIEIQDLSVGFGG